MHVDTVKDAPFMVIDEAFNKWSANCVCHLFDHEYRKFWEILPDGAQYLKIEPIYDGGVTTAIWFEDVKLPPIYTPKIKYQHMTFRLDLTRKDHREWMSHWQDMISAGYNMALVTPEDRMKLWLNFASRLNKPSVDKLGGYWLPAVLNDNVRPKFVPYQWEDKLLG